MNEGDFMLEDEEIEKVLDENSYRKPNHRILRNLLGL